MLLTRMGENQVRVIDQMFPWLNPYWLHGDLMPTSTSNQRNVWQSRSRNQVTYIFYIYQMDDVFLWKIKLYHCHSNKWSILRIKLFVILSFMRRSNNKICQRVVDRLEDWTPTKRIFLPTTTKSRKIDWLKFVFDQR